LVIVNAGTRQKNAAIHNIIQKRANASGYIMMKKLEPEIINLANVFIAELIKYGIPIRCVGYNYNSIGITVDLSDSYFYIEARPEYDKVGAVAKKVYHAEDKETEMMFLDSTGIEYCPHKLMDWVRKHI